MLRTLSQAQERRLLRKHLIGDFGSGRWKTIESLLSHHMIIEDDCGNLTWRKI